MLTQQELETHLSDCAIRLSRSLDPAQTRRYLLTLLFYKWLVDQAEAGASGRTIVPVGCSWHALAAGPARGIARRLDQAMAKVEAANPELRDVLREADWDATVSVGGERRRRVGDGVIHEVVQVLAEHDLSDANVEPDVLARGYEYLMARFAAASRAHGGEYYTPREVVEVMVRLTDPPLRASVHDPTCGSAAMLVYAADWLRRERGVEAVEAMRFSGQERNPETWAIARMNLLLHDVAADIRGGASTLTEPLFVRGRRELQTFDIVLGNFPFSDPEWGHDFLQDDPFGRFRFGIPPRRCGDFAYLQHIVACLNETGRASVVCSQGVLFHAGAESAIRRSMLEQDLVEVVLALPVRLFHGIDSPACVLLLNRRKPDDRRGKVLIVRADRDFEAGPNQNRLRQQDVDRIVAAHTAGEDVAQYCRLVDLEEIASRGFTLSIPQYISEPETPDSDDLRKAAADLREATAARDEAVGRLMGHLAELGLDE